MFLGKKILIILFLLICTVFAYEVNGDGTPVDFSKMSVTARYWGMGKAGSGFANDSGGMLLNPAGLGSIRSTEFSGMSANLLGEFNYSLFNAVYPLENETIGVSLLHETAGVINSSESLDAYGHPIEGDNIENYTNLFCFGYGRQLFFDRLYFGGVMKHLKKKLSYVEGTSTSFDLGLIYKWRESTNLGFTVKNAMQNDLNYSNGASEGEHIKPDYIFSAAWFLLDRNLTLAWDQHSDIDFGRTNIGAEYWWSDTVALRAGLSESELTFGIGFRYDMLQVDYAIRYLEAPMENQAYISVTYGNARKQKLDKPEIELVDEGGIVKQADPLETQRFKTIEAGNVQEDSTKPAVIENNKQEDQSIKIEDQQSDDAVIEII